jgi:predicted transcriptional regulator
MAYHGQTVSIELPEPIFRRLQHIAEVTHRSVEDVLATIVNAALPQTVGAPAEVADELAAMTLFSDAALWTAAKTTFGAEDQHRLDELTQDGAARPLTEVQAAELTELIDAYDRAVLRRAKALALLAQRGYNISAHIGSSASSDERG